MNAARDLLRHAQTETTMLATAVDQIRRAVRLVKADVRTFASLSTGERLAVALVLDRYELVKAYGTMLDAVDRLGQEWLAAARYVQKHGDDE
jgi:hypothetical protein